MGGNQIDDNGAILLDKALRMNGLLRTLTVRLMYNRLTPEAVTLLQKTEEDCGPSVQVESPHQRGRKPLLPSNQPLVAS